MDELHDFKNLETASNIRDAAIDGSNSATDLHSKVKYLRSVHGNRVVTGATATPIANSVTEMYVMQRYLRPDLPEKAGINDCPEVCCGVHGTTLGSTCEAVQAPGAVGPLLPIGAPVVQAFVLRLST